MYVIYFFNREKRPYLDAPNIFIAQLVEHCSANSEAMGLNPVEGMIFFALKFATV